MSSTDKQGCGTPAPTKAAGIGGRLVSATQDGFRRLIRHTHRSGGSALVRRRIQTPSDATVLSVVQPEGEVVLGASPPARRVARSANSSLAQSGQRGGPEGGEGHSEECRRGGQDGGRFRLGTMAKTRVGIN